MPLPPFPIPPAVFRAALGLRRRVLDLADRLMPAEGALWDFAAGMQRTKLAGALVNTGLADALGEMARDPAEVAAELGLDLDVIVRVLGAAAASRLVRIDRDGRARLSRIGLPLRTDHPYSIASWVAYQAAPTNALSYAQLDRLLRDGAEPSGHRRAFGDSIWHYLAEHPEEGARFGNAMRELTVIDAAALARAYPWPRRGVICDVAGGSARCWPPSSVAAMPPEGSSLTLQRCSRRRQASCAHVASPSGSSAVRGICSGELSVQADVYVLKWILHDWSDDACRDILSRVRATMPHGAKVVAIDLQLEPGRPNSIASMSDLHMLVECEGGRERSPREVHALMRDAGLQAGQVRHAGMHALVEGVRL